MAARAKIKPGRNRLRMPPEHLQGHATTPTPWSSANGPDGLVLVWSRLDEVGYGRNASRGSPGQSAHVTAIGFASPGSGIERASDSTALTSDGDSRRQAEMVSRCWSRRHVPPSSPLTR